MGSSSSSADSSSGSPAWQELTANYQNPDRLRSLWQLVNSVVPYLILWYLMYRSLAISYWLTLAVSPLAAGFLIRIFIIFHDCGHGAFFRSKKANDYVGFITGVLTFTPYYRWRREHAMHHATSGDLDRRTVGGEVWTLTVEEYLEAPRRTRLAYRFYRNPLVMLVLGPAVIFLIRHRFTNRRARKRERRNVYWTNLGLLGFIGLVAATMGIKAYLLIQIPVISVGGAIAVWLFYVQHQFEAVYWQRHDQWEYLPAALEGH